MALTESTMLDLGTAAPDFALHRCGQRQDRSPRRLSRQEGAAGDVHLRALPVCEAHRKGRWQRLARIMQASRWASSPSAATMWPRYPDDSPAGLKQQARDLRLHFPYLYDETQDVAHAYEAACTPDFFLFDEDLRLVYRGQFDASRPGNGVPVTGEDLRAAIDAVLAASRSRGSAAVIGCNIKWKA